MDWCEDEVRMLEAAETRPTDDRRPVAFYGSSSIRLWETLQGDFPGIGAINLGFGGSTMEACARYFGRLVARKDPRSLVLYAGDNDLGDGRSPGHVLGSLRDLLRQCDESLGPIPLGFLSIKPSPARWHLDASIRHANDLARALLADRPAARFVDIYPRMLDPSGRPRPELYADDGLHLSPAGYRLWAGTLAEHSRFLF